MVAHPPKYSPSKLSAFQVPQISKSICKLGAILLLAICIIGVPIRGAGIVVSADSGPTVSPQVMPRAENFIANQFDPSVGLVAEYPGADRYWLYSDNYLASYVLLTANPSNLTLQNLGRRISRNLSEYASQVPNVINEYMALNSSKFAFYASTDYDVTSVGYSTISTTQNNGSTALDPAKYGDIAFLESIYYYRTNQQCQALSVFHAGASMYDGTCIKDSAFDGTVYQTYKLALYLYSAKILGESYPSTVLRDLLNRQASNGGFHTGYDLAYSNAGTLTNVETTALAILALTTPVNPAPPKPLCIGATPLLYVAIPLGAVIAIGVPAAFVLKRKRHLHIRVTGNFQYSVESIFRSVSTATS